MKKEEFARIRKKLKLSQTDLGEKLGKTGRMVANYESGSPIPKLVKEKVKNILKCN